MNYLRFITLTRLEILVGMVLITISVLFNLGIISWVVSGCENPKNPTLRPYFAEYDIFRLRRAV